MKIAVFLFDGCEELDWAGPGEVLGQLGEAVAGGRSRRA